MLNNETEMFHVRLRDNPPVIFTIHMDFSRSFFSKWHRNSSVCFLSSLALRRGEQVLPTTGYGSTTPLSR